MQNTISDTERTMTLGSLNQLGLACLQKEIETLHADGFSANKIADKLRIPLAHVATIFAQRCWR